MQHQPGLRVAKRFALQARQPMAQSSMVAFHGIGFLLGLYQLFGRDHHRVDLPVVAHHPTDGNVLDALPELATSSITAVAQHKINKTVAVTVNGYPNPTIVFLWPI